MENEQTQKYENFISAQNFPEDHKNTRIGGGGGGGGGGAKLTIRMQKLCFLYD